MGGSVSVGGEKNNPHLPSLHHSLTWLFRCMFCSLRRLPAHAIVTVSVRAGMATNSSMVSSVGASTTPATVTVCPLHSRHGTAPWLRTKWSPGVVMGPHFSRS